MIIIIEPQTDVPRRYKIGIAVEYRRLKIILSIYRDRILYIFYIFDKYSVYNNIIVDISNS